MTDRRQEFLDRFERASELPLLILAVLMVPLLAIPLLLHLDGATEAAFVAADWFVWAVFAVEYMVRLSLSTKRWRFIRREWPDLLIIVLPFLRPLRIVRSARALRLLRLGRLVAFLGVAGHETRRLLVRHQLHYALLITVGVLVACAAVVFAVEDGSGGSIDSFGDSMWWAVTTITTVGYGDTFPVTPAGRGVAAFLMVSGIALFGVLTANLAAFLLERAPGARADTDNERSTDDRLDEILVRLTALEEALEGDRRAKQVDGGE